MRNSQSYGGRKKKKKKKHFSKNFQCLKSESLIGKSKKLKIQCFNAKYVNARTRDTVSRTSEESFLFLVFRLRKKTLDRGMDLLSRVRIFYRG